MGDSNVSAGKPDIGAPAMTVNQAPEQNGPAPPQPSPAPEADKPAETPAEAPAEEKKDEQTTDAPKQD